VAGLTTHFYTQDGVVKAVDGVSFDIEPAETVAIVGESGCGKSVSALSVLRLIPEPPGRIVKGQVVFEGTDLLGLPPSAMQGVRGGRISMIFQEPLTSLNPVLTIGRQISESLELHQKMNPADALKETARLLKLVGIPQPERRMREHPHKFSGGMRQRVMIAMAISCRPRLIIADEPTTAVDVTVQAQLLELLRELASQFDTALMLITHNLGMVARHANRIYVMYAGRVVEHGSCGDVFSRPRHPYTVALLNSLPRLDEARKMRLDPIGGQPPDLIYPPVGCLFHPRCQYKADDCLASTPPLAPVDSTHHSACLLAHNGKAPWLRT
jgi:peptide/nickel transport system ATP-binding protein/oligopeptide transport system ATP-binding protein